MSSVVIRLALRNVRHFSRDYLIYFLTLTIAVSLFYCFNASGSMSLLAGAEDLPDTVPDILDNLSQIMGKLSILNAFILGFLVLYANQFLITRRRQEFGTYHVLGMKRSSMSVILILETMIIGALSLIMGILLGILLSQLFCTFTASLFVVHVRYHFVFSPHALLITLISFTTISLITVIFNTLILSQSRLTTLLYGAQHIPRFAFNRLRSALLILFAALLMLAGGWALMLSADTLLSQRMALAAFLMIAGTLLFFLAISALLSVFFRRSRIFCYRALNCFILRQITLRLHTGYLSVSIICTMLFLSITTMTAGLSVNNTLNSEIGSLTPYSFSLIHPYTLMGERDTFSYRRFEQEIRKLQLPDDKILYQRFFHTFASEFTYPRLCDLMETMDIDVPLDLRMLDAPLEIMPLSDYNQLRADHGMTKLNLQPGNVILCTSSSRFSSLMSELAMHQPHIMVFGHTMQMLPNAQAALRPSTSSFASDSDAAFLVISDVLIPADAENFCDYWNVQLKAYVSTQHFSKSVDDALWKDGRYQLTMQGAYTENSDQVHESSVGTSVIYTYLGLYTGIILLIASSVVISLQQLSMTQNTRSSYQILRRMGASEEMMRHAVLLQNLTCFILPLSLAVIHSVFGIIFIHSIVSQLGRGHIFISAIEAFGIFLLIYLLYFFITYIGSRSMMENR